MFLLSELFILFPVSNHPCFLMTVSGSQGGLVTCETTYTGTVLAVQYIGAPAPGSAVIYDPTTALAPTVAPAPAAASNATPAASPPPPAATPANSSTSLTAALVRTNPNSLTSLTFFYLFSFPPVCPSDWGVNVTQKYSQGHRRYCT